MLSYYCNIIIVICIIQRLLFGTQNFGSQPLSWIICAALCVSWFLSHPSHQMPDKGETLARLSMAHSLEEYNLPL